MKELDQVFEVAGVRNATVRTGARAYFIGTVYPGARFYGKALSEGWVWGYVYTGAGYHGIGWIKLSSLPKRLKVSPPAYVSRSINNHKGPKKLQLKFKPKPKAPKGDGPELALVIPDGVQIETYGNKEQGGRNKGRSALPNPLTSKHNGGLGTGKKHKGGWRYTTTNNMFAINYAPGATGKGKGKWGFIKADYSLIKPKK